MPLKQSNRSFLKIQGKVASFICLSEAIPSVSNSGQNLWVVPYFYTLHVIRIFVKISQMTNAALTFLSAAMKNQDIHDSKFYVALDLSPLHSIRFVGAVD